MRYSSWIVLVYCGIHALENHEKYAYCHANKNSFIAIVWPIAKGKDKQITTLLNTYGNVVHKEELVLSPARAYKILKKSHYNGPKSVTENFKAHLAWYFPTKELFKKPARIFICTFENANKATQCKYAIRNLFNLSYRPIHINDTHTETCELATLLFK
jgi:hypothetical protein